MIQNRYLVLALFLLILLIVIILVICRNNNIETMEPIFANTFPFQTYIINLERKPERYQSVKEQLDRIGIKNYYKWKATDGFAVKDEEITKYGIMQTLVDNSRAASACSASHVRLWRHIAENKLDWTLILEDDAHFHPDFLSLFYKYWKQVPTNAKIIFLGHCYADRNQKSTENVYSCQAMCNHAYMINHESARYLLDNLLPMHQISDMMIYEYFSNHSGSYIFNGENIVNGIRAHDYKNQNGKICTFEGIVYQNQEQHNITIRDKNDIYL